MDFAVNIVVRLKLANQPGTLAGVLDIIAREGGNLGGIDITSATADYVVRELGVGLGSTASVEQLVCALNELTGVQVLHVADRVLLRHLGGKIEIKARREVENREDLSVIYTPGVAKVTQAIAKEPQLAHQLTMKGNAVAIVTDGSAVLGLGDQGPLAALPVMEGKAVLFKKFAGIDAIPICIDVHDSQSIIDTVVALAPGFGGINLEDIAAPQCFDIEEKLKAKLDIPVFHDDQHGTAIVTTAGLLNALRVVGKSIEQVRIVVSGAGAAGVAITKMLLAAGAQDIIVCDSKGAIARDKLPAEPAKKWLAQHTNTSCVHGSLKQVLAGADVLVGVSAPNLLDRADILTMAARPVVFALANPQPEIEPGTISDVAGVIATGRSDYPNQINNALVFPGIFRGALDCHATTINDDMCLAAAYALADLISDDQLSSEYIIPSIFNPKVCDTIARAVEKAARQTKVARKLPV